MDIYTELEEHLSKYVDAPRDFIDPESIGFEPIELDFDSIEVEGEIFTAWGAQKGETNIFYGGEIQRRAHAEGKHNYDRSETGRKSWANRDVKEAIDKMTSGYQKKLATPEGMAEHIEKSKKGAAAARLVLCKKITYNGKKYLGWQELKNKTGISKHKFIKYNMGSYE